MKKQKNMLFAVNCEPFRAKNSAARISFAPQREIVNLGYFNQEKVTPNIVPNQEDGTVDINWSVEEKSSDQLELSAGWGGGIGLTGTLGVSFNNFSINNIWKKTAWDPLPTGDGQKLSLACAVQRKGISVL